MSYNIQREGESTQLVSCYDLKKGKYFFLIGQKTISTKEKLYKLDYIGKHHYENEKEASHKMREVITVCPIDIGLARIYKDVY